MEDNLAKGARAVEEYGRSLTSAGGREFFLGGAAYNACYSAGLTLALWTDLALRSTDEEQDLSALHTETVQSNDGYDVVALFAAIGVQVKALDQPAGDSPRVNSRGTTLVLVFKRDDEEQTLDVAVPVIRRYALPSDVLALLAQ